MVVWGGQALMIPLPILNSPGGFFIEESSHFFVCFRCSRICRTKPAERMDWTFIDIENRWPTLLYNQTFREYWDTQSFTFTGNHFLSGKVPHYLQIVSAKFLIFLNFLMFCLLSILKGPLIIPTCVAPKQVLGCESRNLLYDFTPFNSHPQYV